ncbi:MAG: YceI family protein [Proteobacteria bacterium]|nr:YceI family protein [Pseudomonadota bacterium]
MHEVTKPLVLEATFHRAGHDPFTVRDTMVGLDAEGSVLRSDFGLGKYVPIVSDRTKIHISAEFRKKSTPG